MIEFFNDKNNITKLNNILNNDGVITFVTDTVWGVGCLPSKPNAVEKIYELKNRDRSKPLILMSNSIVNLLPYIENIPQKAQNLIDKYYPGALTLVLNKSEKTNSYITANKKTVGIRIPDNKFFQILCENISGGVLATTSANHSNQPAAKTYIEAKNNIGNFVDVIFPDYGYSCKGIESSVVGFDEKENLIIFRQGELHVK